jgi:hypothetical protein
MQDVGAGSDGATGGGAPAALAVPFAAASPPAAGPTRIRVFLASSAPAAAEGREAVGFVFANLGDTLARVRPPRPRCRAGLRSARETSHVATDGGGSVSGARAAGARGSAGGRARGAGRLSGPARAV